MFTKIKKYKQQALPIIKGNYLIPMVYLIITFISIIILGYYSRFIDVDLTSVPIIITFRLSIVIVTLSNIISVILLGALAYGKQHMFIDIVNHNKLNLIEQLKVGFTNQLFRNISVHFVRMFYIIVFSFLLIVPGVIKYYQYIMSYYILNKTNQLGPIESMQTSIKYTRGYKKNLFLLDLSYLPWYLLGIFTLGILWLWITPRHLIARTLMFDEIYEKRKPKSI